MAYILCIETATKTCSVSISKDGTSIACVEEHNIHSHASVLTTFIQECIALSEISIQQLDAIAISIGPGSYTGLRIGLSTAKGLCQSLDIPLIAIDTLQILAHSIVHICPEDEAYYIAALDARRDEVYITIYDKNKNQVLKTTPYILKEDSLQEFQNKKWIIVGSGAEKIRTISTYKQIKIVENNNNSAKNMAFDCYLLYKNNTFVNQAYIEPNYLKPFLGVKPKKLTN